MTIVNIYAPSIRAPKYTEQINLKGEIENNTIIL